MAPPRRATARTAALPARRVAAPRRRSTAAAAVAALAPGRLRAARARRRRLRRLARQTSVFALRDVEVARRLAARCRRRCGEALAPELGRSLVALDGGDVEGGSPRVPACSRVRYDRAFPHTLRVVVTPERAVLAAPPRQGRLGRLAPAAACCARSRTRASARCRGSGCRRTRPSRSDELLAPDERRAAAAALAPLAGARSRRASGAVRAKDAELTLVLRSGLELRLGDAGDLRLKLAVARADPPAPGRRHVARTTSTSACRSARSSAGRTLKSKVKLEGYAGRGRGLSH